MDAPTPSAEFVGYLTSSQDELRAYILACLGSYNDSLDVLQATNVLLLKKAKEFATEADFRRWAIAVAKYEVLSFVRDRGRGRLVFSPELVELMTHSAERKIKSLPARHAALMHCLSLLPEGKQELIRMRYAQELTAPQIADAVGKTSSAVKVMLYRLRTALQKCISKQFEARVSPA